MKKPADKPKLGRPRGKRTNPEFVQITAYIRKDTHRNVKIELLKEAKGRELSEVIEDQLSDWLRKHRQKQV